MRPDPVLFLPFCAARTRSALRAIRKRTGKGLNRQNISLKLHGLDGGEPSFERLRADVVSDDFEASCPDAGVILVHGFVYLKRGFTGVVSCFGATHFATR